MDHGVMLVMIARPLLGPRPKAEPSAAATEDSGVTVEPAEQGDEEVPPSGGEA